MKIIIGLGNPGEKYKDNRHNIGYLVVDKLKTQSSKLKDILVFKTNTFMNDSGSFVLKKTKDCGLSTNDLFIVFDDLDIKLGEFKIQFGKGPKDHNGLNDIYEKLGTKDFWHVRVGVDNRDSNERVKGEDYVLQDFTDEEQEILKGVIADVSKKLLL